MSSFRLISILFLLSFLDFSAVKGAPFSGQEETIKGNATIYFQLFTRKNPTEFQILLLNDVEALKKSNYNPDALVKLYAPGWDNDGSIAYPTKDEYLLREDCNVIVIDWREVQSPIYIDTIGTTTRTGLHTGAFIDFLIDNGTPKSAFHLIGHSAGTHVVGVGSPALKSGRVSRITGLDPGRYPTYNSDIELDITDADFVEIVHTNGGTDLDDRAIFDAIGHVDFYANGGHHQPGCEDNHCNHLRTADLFAESINSQLGFKSLLCDTFEHFQQGLCAGNQSEFMGEHTPDSTRGVFQFLTNGESPFARG